MANVGEITAHLVLETDQFNLGMQEAQNSMNTTAQVAQTTSAAIDAIQKAAIAVGTGITAVFAASVTTAANFEQKMKDIESVSGATGLEMEQLGELAKEMGQKTAFSASEAAMGIEELIKAGLTVEQVIGGGLEGALNLAIAGGLELAEAAEIASTALNAFKDDNLTVAQSANILAGAANASATDVGELKYGLSAVSAVAAGMGMTFQDTSTALAVFAQNGLKGSDAGTSLKTMLMNLQPATEAQTDLFFELGLMTEDGTNKFYDQEGSMKSLAEISGLLHESMKGLTDQQRATTLEIMFGSDAVRAGNILYREGAEGVNKMWDAMSKVTAAEVAATKMQSLNGAFIELKSTLETLGIELGSEFLPVLTQITRTATGVLRSLDDMDMANVKAALAFGGTASAIALVATTLIKLGVSLRGLYAAMGPAGWVIVGLSAIGGMMAASAVSTREMSKVSLENAEAMEQQRVALASNIEEYDRLSAKSRLTNEELARFVDVNSLITKTADPKILAKLREEQERLREKSGLSNDELNRMVDLNGMILEVVPDANTTLTEQGNVLLNNTDNAKAYNAEQAELIRLELEAQAAKAEANMSQYLTDEKRLLTEIKDLKTAMQEIDTAELELRGNIGGLEASIAAAKRNNDNAEVNRLNILLGVENGKLRTLQEQKAESAGLVLKKTEELRETQKQIGKLDEVKRQMVDLELKQVGINAKRGEEIKQLDTAVGKLNDQKRKLQETTPAAQRNTQEYRDAVAAIDNQISGLNTARSRINDIIGRASVMNSELGRDINKTVTITEQRYGRVVRGKGGFIPEYHTGGIVGRGQMPKLHVGGLASQFASMPNHNEIDTRLLRNEMVLTEAQQSNLMRMIDAGFTQKTDQSTQGMVDKTEINISQLVVREEADVDRIADALERKKTGAKRGRGLR